MKKGFIERIENNNIVVIYEDKTQQYFSKDEVEFFVDIDYTVEVEDNKIIKVSLPDPKLQEEIKRIEKKIFVPFSERKKK